MQARIEQALTTIANRKDALDWASQDNLLAKVEVIRLRARQEILVLGFDENEISVDVSIIPADSMDLFHQEQVF